MNARRNIALLCGTTGILIIAAIALTVSLNQRPIINLLSVQRSTATLRTSAPTPSARTNAALPSITWSSLQATNYPEYIARLRAFGCPEQTVRDIVITDIAKLYAAKRAEVRRGGETYRFWRAQDPGDPNVERQLAALQREQHKLVRDLFGIELASVRAQYWADDNNQPDYDFLPSDKQQRLTELLARYEAKEEQIYSRSQGSPDLKDENELHRLEQERATELQALLSPEEREQYDLRYSAIAQNLRAQLGGIEPTEEEFKKLFRVYKKYEKDLSEGFTTDQATREQTRTPEREAAERAFQREMRAALGEARFAELQRSQDPAYETLVQVAQRFNLSRDIPAEVYSLKSQAEQQKFEIDSNPKLTPEQRLAALSAIARETERALSSTLGPDVYHTYARAAGDWIESLNQPEIQSSYRGAR
jgi:hypothetical protein